MFCWKCNAEIREAKEDRKRSFCPACIESEEQETEENKRQYLRYKFLNMHERAIKNLENRTLRFSSYKKIFNSIKQLGLEHPDAFESSDEILAYAVLHLCGYHAKTQVRIDNYRVDLYLEKQKTIIEIDGDSHDIKAYYDSNRDKKIRELLGADWEIVRIPSVLLDKNPEMLISAIKQVRQEKVRVRRENGGIIPAYYSRQAQARIHAVEDLLKPGIAKQFNEKWEDIADRNAMLKR